MSTCKYLLMNGKIRECHCRDKCKHQKVKDVGGDSFHSHDYVTVCCRPNTKTQKTEKPVDKCTNP